jgi:hypothetical protein
MRKLFFAVGLLAVAVCIGCGGSSGSSGSGQIVVSVTPNANPVSVGVTLTQQFSASVSGTSNQAVTWTVSGASCSGATCGTVSSTGLYTAPAVVPSPHATVAVVATSQADSSKSRTVNVRVVDILVSVLPNSSTVALNGTQQFTAQANPNSPVSWSVSGSGCANAGCGTVSSTGLYTAPSSLPNPPTVTVKATSTIDPNSTPATALVTLVSSLNSRVKGTYAFRFSGFDGGGAVYSAGIFTADGSGNISAGIEDVNRSTGVQNASFTGSYVVGSDNRGTMTLVAGALTTKYNIAIGSSGEAIFIEADAPGTRGAGIFDKATSTAFSNSALVGPFVMGISGSDLAGKRVGTAGLFTTDGASPLGNVTSGAIDINDAGNHIASPSLSGTYQVASNGRGTMTLNVPSVGTFNFSFYVVSTGELFAVSTDPVSATNPRLGGLVLSQAVNAYSASSFSGNSVFNLIGSNSAQDSVTAVGIMGTDGSGNLTSGSMFDENNAGTIVAQQSLAGTYSVQANGTGTISITSANPPASSFALYAITTNKAFLVDTSSSNALSGILEPQVVGNAGTFSPATIQGAFVTGTTASANTGATNFSGVLALDGSSNVTGTQDTSTPSMNTMMQSVAATYTVTSNGRGTMNLSSPSSTSRILYVVNGSKFITIDVDNGDTTSTVIESER